MNDEANTVETTRQRLVGVSPRANPHISGVSAVVVGGVFLTVGLAIVGVGLEMFPLEHADIPTWLIVIFGAIFALAGLCMLVPGSRGLLRRRRQRRILAAHPDQPWRADHDWDPKQARDTPVAEIVRLLAFAGFLALFLLPFHWIGIEKEGMARLFLAVALFFDLFVLALIGIAFYRALRYLKYGGSVLRFDTFPYFLGQTFSARFEPTGAIRRIRKIRFTLRRVEVVYEHRGTGRHRTVEAVVDQVWADHFEIGDPGAIEAGSSIPVTFLLPDDPALGTLLEHLA